MITLLLIPIGLFLLWLDQRTERRNQEHLSTFLEQLRGSNLNRDEQTRELARYCHHSGFYVKIPAPGRIEISRKRFQVGWLFVGAGFFGIGIVVYLIYYFLISRPKVQIVTL